MGARALPPTLRHRGFGLLLAGRGASELGSAMLPVAVVGLVLAGALAETVGPRPVLVGAAVAGLVTTLVPLAVPGVSRLADPDRPASAL
jgi:MFS-type transporter involved in bile tolerance (Atg22 family)